jgi:hypothetical protein
MKLMTAIFNTRIPRPEVTSTTLLAPTRAQLAAKRVAVLARRFVR